ncbi:MAG TPA: ATP-grasp domain-containing protein [Streptosporangiaceae bacterium]|nr:ATP-grasp domain-containing protein [Streptosporangiaceae bacterium]
MRVLLVGYNESALSGLDRCLPARSVTVLEEPDLWQAKALEPKAAGHPSFRGVVFGRYQQDDEYTTVVARPADIDAVVPGMEYAVQAAAELAENWGLAGAGVSAAATFRDKLLLREATRAAGMTVPEFREVRGLSDLTEFASGRPCVLKPAARQASLGVLLLEPGADLAQAWQLSSTAHEPHQLADRPMTWRYLAEERLVGPEYSTECLVRKGEPVFVNVTRKRTLPGTHPVEVGHTVPGWPGGDPHEPWSTAVADLLAAVPFGTGILHAEWILTSAGPVLVECGGRLPGDKIVDLIDHAWDTNLVELWVRLLAGDAPELPAGPVGGASIQFLVPPAGVVGRIEALEEARACPGVQRADVRIQPGDVLTDPTCSWDRAGSVLAVGSSAAEAERRAGQALSRIRVVPGQPGGCR